MDNKKILYMVQEIAPYQPSTKLAELGRKLPQSIQEKGFEVRTFMPKYGSINERRNQLHEVIRLSGMNIVIDDNDHPLIIKVATLQPTRMQVYFIDNEDYFQHRGAKDLEIYATPEDNDERIMFFVRGVVETVKKLRWEPAVIHNVGWISALAPLYLKRIYNEDPSFRSSKLVYSLVDDSFEGTLSERFVEKLLMDGFTEADLDVISDGKVTYRDLVRLAVKYSDGVVQCTPDADPELIEFVKSSGIPFLPYQDDENSADAYVEFYNSL